MIPTTRTIRMVSRTSIAITTVFIVKVNVKISDMHSLHFLTNSLITIKNKWSSWRKNNFTVGITIASAAVISPGIAVIITTWKWQLLSISISTIFIIPLYRTRIEMIWTTIAILSNAILSLWPAEPITNQVVCLRAIMGSKITPSVETKKGANITRTPSVCVSFVFIILISPPT